MTPLNGRAPRKEPFRSGVIDPPWPYQGAGSDRKLHGYASNLEVAERQDHQYDLLSIRDMAALPVGEVISDYLFLWATGPWLPHGFDLIKAWGFEYITAIHWLKKTASGKTVYGPGFWYRSALETVLVARKPGIKAIRTQTRNVFESERRGHSEKPEYLQDHIEAHFPGPYLELFARRVRPGWTCLGNECPGDGRDIRDSLPGLLIRPRKRLA